MTSPVDPVQQLLQKNEFLKIVELGQGDKKYVRIKCQLTQHEMLPRVDIIKQHLKSKKFVKARDWYCHDYSQYEPYIVPHRELHKNLYCNVTGIILNRIPFEVEKHVQGKRYKRMKQHVKIKLTKNEDDGDDEAQYKADFDADAFESENKQVLYSIDGEQEDNEDDNESDASLEGVKLKKDEEIDDLADLYPKELDHSMNNEDGDHRREKCSRRKRLADSKMFTEQTTKKMKKTV